MVGPAGPPCLQGTPVWLLLQLLFCSSMCSGTGTLVLDLCEACWLTRGVMSNLSFVTLSTSSPTQGLSQE